MSLNIAEKAWLEAPIYNRAMDNYHTFLARQQQKAAGDAITPPVRQTASPVIASKATVQSSSLVTKIQETRNTIKAALSTEPNANAPSGKLEQRIGAIETENKVLKEELAAMCDRFAALEARLNNMTGSPTPVKKVEEPAPVEDDDDVDLFGSDSEDEDAKAEAERIKAERIEAYMARKTTKKVIIAKSNIILDVKPWDDETDMALLEQEVRAIEADGLLWGTGKLVAVGYGIKKLQISLVVEDDKVGTDFLEEHITALEDLVQSVDVVAFNKI